ncbi:MAG: hypothetical protein JWO11_1973 [Nocardioides sp.]|nr:hypothetical protein [Nocardioides sp.]
MNETLQLPRAAAARPATERPAGVRRVLLDSGYSLSAFFLAIPALVVVSVGLALGAGLLVLLAGFFVLMATTYVARGFAHAERARLRSMKGVDDPTPTYVVAREGAGPLRRALTSLRDPQSWLDVVWALVGWVTATIAFAVTLAWWAAAAGGLSYWYWQRFIDFGEDNTTLAELLDLGKGRTPEIWLNLAIGVVALITLPLVTRLVAALHAGLARLLLTTRA